MYTYIGALGAGGSPRATGSGGGERAGQSEEAGEKSWEVRGEKSWAPGSPKERGGWAPGSPRREVLTPSAPPGRRLVCGKESSSTRSGSERAGSGSAGARPGKVSLGLLMLLYSFCSMDLGFVCATVLEVLWRFAENAICPCKITNKYYQQVYQPVKVSAAGPRGVWADPESHQRQL